MRVPAILMLVSMSAIAVALVGSDADEKAQPSIQKKAPSTLDAESSIDGQARPSSDVSGNEGLDVTQLSDLAVPCLNDRAGEQGLRSKLLRTTSFHVKNVPLEQAIKRVCREAGELSVWFDRTALTEDGRSLDETVSITMKDVEVVDVLDRLVTSRGLSWYLAGPLVVVTTAVVAEERMVLKSYDVHVILEMMAREGFTRGDRRNATSGVVLFQFGGSGKPSTHVAFMESRFIRADIPVTTAADHLMEVIMLASTGCDWASFDSPPLGELSVFDGALFVRTTPFRHDIVQALVDGLNAAAEGKIHRQALEIHPWHFPRQSQRTAYEKLEEEIPGWRVNGLPISSLPELIRRKSGIECAIDEKSLAEESIELTERISLELGAASTRTFLQTALKPLGLTFQVRRSVITITSEWACEGNGDAVLYDVGDLVDTADGSDDLVQSLVNLVPRGGTNQSSVFVAPWNGTLLVFHHRTAQQSIASMLQAIRGNRGGKTGERAEKRGVGELELRIYALPREVAAEQTLKAIQALVVPDVPLEEGSVRVLGNSIVVRHNRNTHDRIARFVTALWNTQPLNLD